MGVTIAIVLVIIAVFVVWGLFSSIRVVKQGFVGVVTRFGEFDRLVDPGLCFLMPVIDRLMIVDTRETPRTGDRQQVITLDNVSVIVNATIFSQVVDAKLALFGVSNYILAIEQQAKTALRAVFGGISLQDALSEREQMATALQAQIERDTDKWGIRITKVEILEITPPENILNAMALQKQAAQEKTARVTQSEGQQLSQINLAEGAKQAAIKQAEGESQSAILRAQGAKQAAILEAEGRAQAIQTVYSAITGSHPDPTLVAILQLDTLGKIAASNNAKLIIPAESAAFLGAAQALKGTFAAFGEEIVGSPNGKTADAGAV